MLSTSEAFLWQCARNWRTPHAAPLPADAAWERIVAIAIDNKMAPLLCGYLEAHDGLQRLPAAARERLHQETAMYDYRAHLFARALRQFLEYAARRELDVVVLKGLWLSLRIYGAPRLRPGGDIDLFLRERDVPRALDILEYEMGYGRWWRPIMDDRYYARHHLHQQRCNPGRAIWFEPHWRFDHPYTQLTFDYEAMMDRTRKGELLGEPVRELAPADLLLSLAIHLVKHAVYLRATWKREDVAQLILADGMLMYFLDVAEVLKLCEDEFPWQQVVSEAKKTGSVSALGAVLRICAKHLEAPVPGWVLRALPVTPPGPFAQKLMNLMADNILDAYAGKKPSRLWQFLAGYKETVIFRPIRLLDFLHYAFPESDFLRRRYSAASSGVAIYHALFALLQYVRVGVDTAYYTWQRERRLRRLNPEELALCDARYDPLLAERGEYSVFDEDKARFGAKKI